MTRQPFLARISLGVCSAALLLSACGGGGSDDASQADSASASAPPAFSALLGTYAVACTGRKDPDTGSSSQGTATITPSAQTGVADVSMRVLAYETPVADPAGQRCDPAALTLDATVSGQIRPLGTTKTVRRSDSRQDGKRYTVDLVEFTYTGLKISKGAFNGALPLPNVTARVGWRLEGTELRLTQGPREPDGVGDRLSERVGVKQ